MVMDRIKVDLENCYGIKALHYEFDFSEKPAWAIYAPNGVMKTSLAETFQDAAIPKDSEDRIFPKRPALRSIKDQTSHGVLRPHPSAPPLRACANEPSPNDIAASSR